MKTKLLRKLRRQAEKKIGVWKVYDDIYKIGYWDSYTTDYYEFLAIEKCKEKRRDFIWEEIYRRRLPKRIL